MILVDTIVLLDVLQDDPHWADWSQDQLDAASVTDALAINSVIYAELSISFAKIEELEDAISTAELAVEPLPREALFLAGKAFLRYRRTATKQHVSPDFFIGAHAAVNDWPLLTRDAKRYRTYFPTVELITPP